MMSCILLFELGLNVTLVFLTQKFMAVAKSFIIPIICWILPIL